MSVKQCTQLTQLLMKIKVLADTLDPQTDRGKCEHHIATIRCSIIKQIKRYKVNLEKTLNTDTVCYVIVAMVLFLDEWIIKRYFMRRVMQWSLLLQCLLNVCNGGDLFYCVLDKLLRSPRQEAIVYETYYYFLKDGFQGMHSNIKEIRHYYLKKMENILCLKKRPLPATK